MNELTKQLPERCGCCGREGCLRDRLPAMPIDAILAAPSGEHCAVIRYGHTVWKFVKCGQRGHNRAHYQRCAAFAAEHPTWFAPLDFDPDAMIVRQPFIPGRRATTTESNGLNIALIEAGIYNAFDVVGHNIIVSEADSPWRGRAMIIDFGLLRTVGKPCCQ